MVYTKQWRSTKVSYTIKIKVRHQNLLQKVEWEDHYHKYLVLGGEQQFGKENPQCISNIIHEFSYSLVGISQISEVHWELSKLVFDDFPKHKLIPWQYILNFYLRTY